MGLSFELPLLHGPPLWLWDGGIEASSLGTLRPVRLLSSQMDEFLGPSAVRFTAPSWILVNCTPDADL